MFSIEDNRTKLMPTFWLIGILWSVMFHWINCGAPEFGAIAVVQFISVRDTNFACEEKHLEMLHTTDLAVQSNAAVCVLSDSKSLVITYCGRIVGGIVSVIIEITTIYDKSIIDVPVWMFMLGIRLSTHVYVIKRFIFIAYFMGLTIDIPWRTGHQAILCWAHFAKPF